MLIGIGDSGKKTLQILRQLLYGQFGYKNRFGRTSLPGVEFLSLHKKPHSKTIDSNILLEDHPDKDIYSFHSAEWIDLHFDIPYMLNLLQNNVSGVPHITEWWDDNNSDIHQQKNHPFPTESRSISRLGIFEKSNRIMQHIHQNEVRLRNVDIENHNIMMNEPTHAYIICSLAGGTGSGAFLDIAAMLRLSVPNVKIIGTLILPDIFVQYIPGKGNRLNANGAAALRELNHYTQHPFVVRYKSDQKPQKISQLFDQTFLISGQNGGHSPIQSPHDAYRVIAQSLYMRFLGIFGSTQKIQENLFPQRKKTIDFKKNHTLIQRWKTPFSSLGAFSLYYPTTRLLQYASMSLTKKLLHSLISPAPSHNIDALTKQFLHEWGILHGTLPNHMNEVYKDNYVFQLQNHLSKVQQSNIIHEIQRVADQLVDSSETFIKNPGKTTSVCNQRWSDLENKLLFSTDPIGIGEWSKSIIRNGITLRYHLQETIESVLDSFFQQYRLTTVLSITKNCIATILSSDPKFYITYLQNRKTQLIAELKPLKECWKRDVQIAEKASQRSLFFTTNPMLHKKKLQQSTLSLVQYWQNITHIQIADTGLQILETAIEILEKQKPKLQEIIKLVQKNHSKAKAIQQEWSQKKKNTIYNELTTHEDLTTILYPYLGKTQRDQNKNLERYRTKNIHSLKLHSLTECEKNLKTNRFFSHMVHRTYVDLQGDDKGHTYAFSEKPKAGFLRRHSFQQALKHTKTKKELQQKIERIVRYSLPLCVSFSTHLQHPTDTYFVVISPFSPEDHNRRFLQNVLEFHTPAKTIQYVHMPHISHVSIYSERGTFPIFYPSVLHGPRGMLKDYKELIKDTPLHPCKDFIEFEPLYTPIY